MAFGWIKEAPGNLWNGTKEYARNFAKATVGGAVEATFTNLYDRLRLNVKKTVKDVFDTYIVQPGTGLVDTLTDIVTLHPFRGASRIAVVAGTIITGTGTVAKDFVDIPVDTLIAAGQGASRMLGGLGGHDIKTDPTFAERDSTLRIKSPWSYEQSANWTGVYANGAAGATTVVNDSDNNGDDAANVA